MNLVGLLMTATPPSAAGEVDVSELDIAVPEEGGA
ncbi:MAG: hypothetical protein BWY82_02418 [Verrucomicrobia bacterium ADurb.Bin474]|nr:MAG: hypothetical protein BWY82_02418 [Verrucomicrobia bacterium ADurb.Bin474]